MKTIRILILSLIVLLFSACANNNKVNNDFINKEAKERKIFDNDEWIPVNKDNIKIDKVVK